MIALISEQQPADVSTILNLALGATTRGGLGKPVRSPGQELDPVPSNDHQDTVPHSPMTATLVCSCVTTWAQCLLAPVEKKKEVN